LAFSIPDKQTLFPSLAVDRLYQEAWSLSMLRSAAYLDNWAKILLERLKLVPS
jgi:hypothetical protein